MSGNTKPVGSGSTDTTPPKDTDNSSGGDGGGTPPIPSGDPAAEMAKTMKEAQVAQAAMLAAQTAIQTAGMTAQIATAGLNIMGQTVGATTAMAVQTVKDLVETTKSAVKDQGEAFKAKG
jgi:hypothetical protein